MKRFLIRAAIFIATVIGGLLLAWLLLSDLTLSVPGFITAVVVFAVAQSILAPLINSLTLKYAPRLIGGVGLISTFAALLIASLFPDGIQISGIATWVLATLIVWLVTALGGWILLAIFVKNRATS